MCKTEMVTRREMENGVERIYVWMSDVSHTVLDFLQDEMADNRINPDHYQKAKLCYCGQFGTPAAEAKNYPLRFIGDGKELWVSGVSTGSRSEGSQVALYALEMMGFMFGRELREKVFTTMGKELVLSKQSVLC